MSKQRAKANKTNALASTGPKTLAGKARAARNALQHGILSQEVVIQSGAGAENPAEYAVLLAALQDDLRPQGALEELLVEKLAAVTWRWRRVLRYEAGAIRQGADEPVKAESLRRVEDLEFELEVQEDYFNALSLENLKLESPSLEVARLFAYAANRQGIEVEEMFDLDGLDPDSDFDERTWTRADLERIVKAYADSIGVDEPWLALTELRWKMSQSMHLLRPQVVALKLKHERAALLASLPTQDKLEKLIKYEATLSREMERTLSQIERARALRSRPEQVLEAERGEDGTFEVKAS